MRPGEPEGVDPASTSFTSFSYDGAEEPSAATQSFGGFFMGGTPPGVPFAVSKRASEGEVRALDVTVESAGAGGHFVVEVYKRKSGASLCRTPRLACGAEPGTVRTLACHRSYESGAQVALRLREADCSAPPRLNAIVQVAE